MRREDSDSGRRLAYRRQDSGQTLAEGLDEYYAANLGVVTRPSDLPPESAALFRNHDICHVIFGLDTTIADEAMADSRTLMSCDVGMRRYLAYLAQDSQAKAVFKAAGYGRTAWITLLTMPRICRAALEAFRMRRRWPWTPPDSFQGRTLADLRREFGIRVI
ncbi:MAG TPA: hypothetical protein VIE16_05945 [Phenylobacterium sp.]|jgi:hypothetical protein